MLSALLSNPHELFYALVTIYNSLYKINDIQHNKEISATEKTSMLKIQEYVFSQTTIEYLENILMPVLHRAFEETNDYKADEAKITQQELDELNSDATIACFCYCKYSRSKTDRIIVLTATILISVVYIL